MCVDWIQTDKKDVMNFKLWIGMSSVSIHRSTIGYGRVIAPESLEDLTDDMRHLENLETGWEWTVQGGGTWYSPLETIQGNS